GKEMVRFWSHASKTHGTTSLLNEDKRKDRHLIRKLERAVEHAEDRKERNKQTARPPKLEDVLAMEDAAFGKAPDESDSSDKKAPHRQKRSAAGPEIILRDKYGVKLYSVGGQYHLDVCVNGAKNYPGCYSFRIFAAGQKLWYTFGKNEMRALAKEIARAF